MRIFDYRRDDDCIVTSVKGYIKQMKKELNLLYNEYHLDIYLDGINLLNEFIIKYPDLSVVQHKIIEDLLKKENFEYCFIHHNYPENASVLGQQFQNDLLKIIQYEEKMRIVSANIWKNSLTSFDDINNGDDFMVVAHAGYLLPGVSNNYNYKKGIHHKHFLSSSLFSEKELNAFNDYNILYIVNVDSDNFIAASEDDCVTDETNYPSFQSIKEIEDDNKKVYVRVGYLYDSNKAVTSILTPSIVERLSIERELERRGELYNYEGLLTCEIVLDRAKTVCNSAILLSNGCDLLLSDYVYLKENNIPFKCINKGLYKKKAGYKPYTREEFNRFLQCFSNLKMIGYNNPKILLMYYKEVIIPMNYDSEIMDILNYEFSKYIDCSDIKNKTI